jgi:predicted N-acyltransferase
MPAKQPIDPSNPVVRVTQSLADVSPANWNALANGASRLNPFLRHEFLHGLHQSGCVGGQSGWSPRFLTLWAPQPGGEVITAAMPIYVKHHSYGEYVFDWAWADAYQRSGLEYYPKLLSAIPFSPVTGPRLLATQLADRKLLIRAALQAAKDFSSLHILYPTAEEARELGAGGLQLRRGVQFHWCNRGYQNFEQFLGDLSSAKRKKIRQERRRVADAGVTFRRLVGTDITEQDWQFFNRCYASTYRVHHSTPYLNLAFFKSIGESMPENLLLVVAELDGKPVASALNVFSEAALYGRYWGTLGHVPMLHFETCYYQALEFCIERNIPVFEGGAQGEHKLSRGFMPSETWSAHWLAHPEFSDAVKRFLDRESAGMERYVDELNDRSPFRREEP